MIDLKHYERILDSGLLLDHYMVLCMIKNDEKLPSNKRVQGFVNLLNKKGYILDGVLTDEGISITEYDVLVDVGAKDKDTDFLKWVLDLHKRCQMKLLQLVGGKQVRGKINGKPYPFLPNSTDMAKSLRRAIAIYKLKDLDKIEKAIMGHIDKCHKARSWFPLMKYYIIKGGVSDASSDMVTDLDNIDEKDETDNKSLQKFV